VIDCINLYAQEGGHFEHLIWTCWLFWLTSTALVTHDLWVLLFKNSYFSKVKADFYETMYRSNICNRCRLVCVCKILFKSDQLCGCYCKMFRGLSFFGTHCISLCVSKSHSLSHAPFLISWELSLWLAVQLISRVTCLSICPRYK